jgi:hypothetical protein
VKSVKSVVKFFKVISAINFPNFRVVVNTRFNALLQIPC